MVKNKFFVGDSLELMILQGNINFILEQMENVKGDVMLVVSGDGYIVWMFVLQDVMLDYVLLMCNFLGELMCNFYVKQLIVVIFLWWEDFQKLIIYCFV